MGFRYIFIESYWNVPCYVGFNPVLYFSDERGMTRERPPNRSVRAICFPENACMRRAVGRGDLGKK